MFIGKMFRVIAAQINKIANWFWQKDPIAIMQYEVDRATEQLKEGRQGFEQYAGLVETVKRQVAGNERHVNDLTAKIKARLQAGLRAEAATLALRVALARTLILKPRIILMDEPFGALDPQTRLHMQDLVATLWREVEATVFLVTHSIDEAVYLGDRVYIISNSPGTLLKEIAVPPPDRPSYIMRKEPQFQELVFFIRDTLCQLEEGKE